MRFPIEIHYDCCICEYLAPLPFFNAKFGYLHDERLEHARVRLVTFCREVTSRSRHARASEVGVVSTRYRVLVADPPWKHNDPLGHRGAAANYKVMTLDAIKQFPLPPLHDDATLFLWRCASMQQEALDVIEAWGFALKCEIVWIKTTTRGKHCFGFGNMARRAHETCVIATRGKPKTLNHSIRSFFEAPVGAHSEKPEEFFHIVERLREGPRAELFARRLRVGWDCFGDELRVTDAFVLRAAEDVTGRHA